MKLKIAALLAVLGIAGGAASVVGQETVKPAAAGIYCWFGPNLWFGDWGCVRY